MKIDSLNKQMQQFICDAAVSSGLLGDEDLKGFDNSESSIKKLHAIGSIVMANLENGFIDNLVIQDIFDDYKCFVLFKSKLSKSIASNSGTNISAT